MLQKLKSFSIGLIFGAGLGAISALLFTPDSGANLRQKSRHHFQDVLLESAKAAQTRRQELRDQLTQMTSVAEEE